MRKLYFILSVFLGSTSLAQAPESYLEHAKKLAATKEYTEALDFLSKGLEKYPNNHGLKNYQIKVLLWSKNYVDAKVLIDTLLSRFPNDKDGLQLLITLNWWSENWEELLRSTENALLMFPENADFKLKKVIALKELERYSEASDFMKTVSGISPELEEEINLRHHQQVGISGSYSHFIENFNPWLLGTLKYQRISKNSLNLSVMNGKMFNQTGSSFNAEYYSKFSNNLSGFLETGASQSSIFPTLRVGGELIILLKNLEISVGGKMLKFKSQNEGATLFTAGLGKYFGRYFTNYKVYSSQVGPTQSLTHTLLVRRFFRNRFHYVQLNLTNGTIPLQIRNLSDINRIDSKSVLITYSHLIDVKYIFTISSGVQTEEYLEGLDRLRNTVKVGVARLIF